MTAPVPPNEIDRLQALHRYEVLDTPAEDEFDDFTALAAQICETPISLVSLVDETRQWFKSKIGVEVDEMPRDVAFCAHTILDDHLLEIPDALNDDRFRENPLVISDPNIRFYAGAPLVAPDGFKLGSLCVIDCEPRQLDRHQREALARLSRQVVRLLELRRQRFLLEQAYARLRELESLRDSLVQMIVHDMRSQLGGVTGYLQLLAMHELPAAAQEDITGATNAAQDLLEMIRSLLDVSRLEAGEMPLKLADTDIRQLLESAIKRTESQRNGRTITLKTPDTGTVVRCDPELISRVVQNLIGNALKFTDEETGRIEVTAESNGDSVEVSVVDNGPGIPAEHQSKIFDKFFQVQNRPTTGHSTGLGLAFCKLAVEAHGGAIAVDCTSGDGTAFRFSLPAAAKTHSRDGGANPD